MEPFGTGNMQQADLIDDQQLTKAFATTGDQAAFRQLVDRHAGWLFAAAYRQLRNHHLAQDAVQVVFALFAQRAHRMNSRQKISGWLFNTLQFTVKNLRRTERTRSRRESAAACSPIQPPQVDSIAASECAEQLDAAVARLSDPYRTAILLRFYQQMPIDELAQSLGTTEAAARKRIERGLVGLRKLLGTGADAETLLSATAVIGLDQLPTGLAHTVAHSALATGALPPAVGGMVKAVGYLMAMAKLQTLAIIAAVCAAVVVPATIVTVQAMRPGTGTPIVLTADVVPDPTTVGGTVVDEAGKPLPGTHVHLQWVEGKLTRHVRKADVSTDAAGHWEYGPLHLEKPDEIGIQLTHSGLVVDDRATPHSGKIADQSAQFVMVKGISIVGTVADDQDNPIPGASVSTIGVWYISNDSGTTVKTDAFGHFSLPPRRPGSVSLTVTAKGFAPELQRVDVATGMPLVQVMLSAGKTLRARIVDVNGHPIQGVSIQTRRWRGMESLRWEGKTDRDGRFVMPDAPPDAIEFAINKTGYRDLVGQTDASLTAGDQEIVLTMKERPKVSGRVVDADTGAPISKFQLVTGWVFWAGHPPFFMFDRSDKFTNGNYQLTMDGHSEVLTFYIRIEADGYAPALSPPFDASGTHDFKLHRAQKIKGRLVDADGQAVANAQVLLVLPGSQVNLSDGKLERADEEREAHTDGDGRFEFGPESGRFHLLALSDNGYAQAIFNKQPDDAIELKLSPWATVEATYPGVDSGDVSAGLQVWIMPVQSLRNVDVNYEWNSTVTTKAAGEFELAKMPSFDGRPVQLGMGRFIENGPSERRWISTRLTGGHTVKVDLSGVTIKGQLSKSGAGSVSGPGRFLLKSLLEGPSRNWPADWADAKDLPGPLYLAEFHGPGGFTLRGVRPGKYVYEASIEAEDFLAHWGTVEIPPGDSDRTIDVGQIVCEPRPALKVGEHLPADLGLGMDDAPIRGSNFAGKFLLLVSWSSNDAFASDAAVELGKQFSGDGRVALLGLNRDVTDDDTPGRPSGLSAGGWTNAYVPQLGRDLCYEFLGKNRPQIVIAGPDGKLLAVDVPLKDAAKMMEKFLADSGDRK